MGFAEAVQCISRLNVCDNVEKVMSVLYFEYTAKTSIFRFLIDYSFKGQLCY